jgi:hypothetical protein
MVLALGGCHAVIPPAPHTLSLTVDPPPPADLPSGTIVSVRAVAGPDVDMAWVSGTVGIIGAPVAAFRRGSGGGWLFRTMVPPMVTIPPGVYKVKAWGRTTDGELLRATLNYEVQ